MLVGGSGHTGQPPDPSYASASISRCAPGGSKQVCTGMLRRSDLLKSPRISAWPSAWL